jgi:DNA-binding NarL/FixJ family response regulator
MSVIRIVIADDHAIVRGGLAALLNGTPGMQVDGEAANGVEACRLAAELAPDVVIMDMSMPLMDGIAATSQIRAETPGVHVLALTMHEDRRHLEAALEAGAAGYMLKRADPAELLRAIRSVAAGRTYVDPELGGSVLQRRQAPAGGPLPLSRREEEVLRRTAWGASNKDMAEELGISTKTVETYKARITEKLGLRSRADMVRYAVEHGWLSADPTS